MNAARELFQALGEARAFDALDPQIATTLVRRAGESGERAQAIALAAAFISRAVREGHSAITLAELSRQAVQVKAGLGGAALEALPVSNEKWWARALAASPLVGDGAAAKSRAAGTAAALDDAVEVPPLILRDGLLQFRRYYDAERRIAARLHELLLAPAASGVLAFSIITGGPGTGKTTMVARKLVDLAANEPGLRAALAAPTGKAAARLTESIRQRLGEVKQEKGGNAKPPADARTVHRLLGYSPRTDTFKRNAADPLDDDLVIVDETSMVDVLMLDAILRALKPGARLMLVGDHNQLASVDAGDVLGALCRAALAVPPGSPLRECVTLLEKSWRFEKQPAIGTLANAILAGDGDAVLRACANGATPEVCTRPPAASTDALLEPVVPNLERCLAAASPEALLDALDSFRLLAPEREGRMGVQGINAAVERWLTRHGHSVHDPWYHGRPVLVTANDYATGVFNGDLGVVWREAGTVTVHFRGPDGATRAIAPVRLPSVETAWAMTVHKAQGSEFDDVLVVVPESESRVMNRELLYTAVTRARRGVTIVGSGGAIRSAVGRSTGRVSGLGGRVNELQPI